MQQIDAEGYLIEPDTWDESFARKTAQTLGIMLDERHWEALRFMRECQAEKGVTPDVRFVIRHLAETYDADRNLIFELFPYGYAGQACRIAGMKRPRAWSTG
ncbi:MAG: TusE/DsrC/DsvC family sulfur relay protein [Alphaproteobacteria bacterium]|nr:TusE/DsrC/DsvC family sulfur relay protein [Alphaproteobacteria bacterium]